MGQVLTSLQFMYFFNVCTLGAMEGDCSIPFYQNAYNCSTLLYIEPYDWPVSELVTYICSRSSESSSSCQHNAYNVHLFQIIGLIPTQEVLYLCMDGLSLHDELKMWQQNSFVF